MTKHLFSNLASGRPKGAKSFNPVHAKAFGMALRQARSAKGLSQEKLADKAGIERAHIGKIEHGEHIPSLSIVLMCAQALQLPAADLMATTEKLLETKQLEGEEF